MSNGGQKETDVNWTTTPARRTNIVSPFVAVTPSPHSHNHSSVPASKRSRSDQLTQDASIDNTFCSLDSSVAKCSGVEDETWDPLPINVHKTYPFDQNILQTLELFNVDRKGMYTKTPLQ